MAEELERRKLALEVADLEARSGWLARHVGTILSVAAVLITLMQFGYGEIRRQADENAADRAKKEATARAERELEVACNAAGAQAAQIFTDSWELFGKLGPEEKVNFANAILASLPAGMAERLLSALAPRLDANNRGLISAYQSAIERAAAARPAPGERAAACPQVTQLLAASAAAPVVLPDRPAVAGPPSPTAPPPAPSAPRLTPNDTRIDIFTQIVEQDDRDPARALIEAVKAEAETWPGAPAVSREPIEFVPIRNASFQKAEVRYYFADQRAFAERLAVAIRDAAAARGITGLADIQAVGIGGRFPNLPRGRIEVWMPPLR